MTSRDGQKLGPKFQFIYQPVEPKIQPNVGLLRPKKTQITPKQLPSNLEYRKLVFPPKRSKMTPQNRQNQQIFDPHFRF